jgi:hypothetical protein
MEQTNATPVDMVQYVYGQKRIALQNQIKGGMSWFYWIAGTSVVNSVLFFTGSKLTFVMGLIATQFIDGFSYGMQLRASPGLVTLLQVITVILNVFFAGLFLLFAYLGRKRYRWAIVAGMVLYALDALGAIYFKDWVGAGFHGLALFGLFSGLKAINALILLEKNPPASPAPLPAPVAESPDM